MSTIYWTNSTLDGSWDTANNWSPAQVPVSADDVVVRQGNGDITTGLDQSDVNLTTLTVESTYTGDIGSYTNFLQINTDRLTWLGSATMYLALGAASALNPTVHCNGSGVIWIQGDIDECRCFNGSVYFDDVSACEKVWVEKTGKLMLTETGDPQVTLIRLVSGSVSQMGGDVDSLIMTAGNYAVTNTAVLSNVELHAGTLVFNTNSTLDDALIIGGTLDLSRDARSKTITNMEAHSKSTINIANNTDNITITNGIKSYGANVITDIGTEYTV